MRVWVAMQLRSSPDSKRSVRERKLSGRLNDMLNEVYHTCDATRGEAEDRVE